MDKKAFFKLTYGLYVVSSSYEGKDAACLVNTLAQVTSEPPRLSVAVSKDNFTTDIIRKSGYFVGTPVIQDIDMETLGTFGFKSSRDIEKFSNVNHKKDENGITYLAQDVASRYSCKVEKEIDLGTHILFIGLVSEAEVISDKEVLTYTYYHAVKKGGTPKNAPSYKGGEEMSEKGYKCKVCGFIHEEETLPEDFICPLCGVGADQFEKL